ncbi:hypothetical protein F5Y07DRAFT_351367 [Xylaria sp. FL0933]|nr:hypothetical protein F5Y07DRAFT_351367 [Xylaria sp. FL0933]
MLLARTIMAFKHCTALFSALCHAGAVIMHSLSGHACVSNACLPDCCLHCSGGNSMVLVAVHVFHVKSSVVCRLHYPGRYSSVVLQNPHKDEVKGHESCRPRYARVFSELLSKRNCHPGIFCPIEPTRGYYPTTT